MFCKRYFLRFFKIYIALFQTSFWSHVCRYKLFYFTMAHFTKIYSDSKPFCYYLIFYTCLSTSLDKNIMSHALWCINYRLMKTWCYFFIKNGVLNVRIIYFIYFYFYMLRINMRFYNFNLIIFNVLTLNTFCLMKIQDVPPSLSLSIILFLLYFKNSLKLILTIYVKYSFSYRHFKVMVGGK